MQLTSEAAQDDLIGTPSFVQSLSDATKGSVSARDCDTSTLRAVSAATSGGGAESLRIPIRQQAPVPAPVRPKQSISAGVKGLLMSPGKRAALAADLCQACEYRNLNKVRDLLLNE